MIHNAEELLRLAAQTAQLRGRLDAEELQRILRRAYQIAENYNYDFQTNGELHLLQRLARFGITAVFDVGANIGEWTTLALSTFSGASVHSFEPIGETFGRLSAALGAEVRAQLFNFALWAEDGEISLRHYRENPGQTSAFEFPSPCAHEDRVCVARSLDSFTAQAGVSHIDLLKIDVEGAEHKVLSGMTRLLAARAVRVIQFEYGFISINTGFLLKDFYATLGAAGFKVGKIYPHWVDFSDYSLEKENFIGPNFVAVLESEPEIIRTLAEYSGPAV